MWLGSTLVSIRYKQYYQGLDCLPFSAVWAGSTLFAVPICLIRLCTICHSQSDQRLHYLPFWAVWLGSTLFAILSKQIYQGLHYLQFFLSSIIKGYTFCHIHQFNQGLFYLRFSAVWSRSRSTLSFSETVWSETTLFAIDSSLIRVHTVCHSQRSDQRLHCLPFSAV